jgi:hypothetical protein
MITLTPDEERLRARLIERARAADPADPAASTSTYGSWAEELDTDGSAGWKQGAPRYTRLITALWHINSYETEHGRPMVGAFAVSKTTGHSGDGFMKLRRDLHLPIPPDEDGTGRATWREVLSEALSYWQADDSREAAGTGGMTDAQFDTIMGELSKIKQMLRQLLHG